MSDSTPCQPRWCDGETFASLELEQEHARSFAQQFGFELHEPEAELSRILQSGSDDERVDAELAALAGLRRGELL
jgi:hypothetical protein